MNTLKIDYFAIVNNIKYPGVVKKIRHIVKIYNELGHEAKDLIIHNLSVKSLILVLKNIYKSTSSVIIIRNHPLLIIITLPAIIVKRISGTKFILDVPTPIKTVLFEIIYDYNYGFVKKTVLLITYLVLYPLVFTPFNLILEYSIEGKYFQLGQFRKFKLVSNGIDTKSIPFKIDKIQFDNIVYFIAVASISFWHGYDRLIKGIHNYYASNSKKPRTDIILKIVGDGKEKKSLLDLAENLNISDKIQFIGTKTGTDLDILFEKAHIGISSLGVHRKSIEFASDLKSREYCARGLPFVISNSDIDFEPLPEFVFKVSNTDMDIDIIAIVDWYERLEKKSDLKQCIRRYAIEKIDYRVKLNEILGEIR